MASRNRLIAQSTALFVGPSPASGDHFSLGNSGINYVRELHRVQEINIGNSVTRQDVNVLGRLAAIDRQIVESPTVTLDATYYPTNGYNELCLGMNTSGQISAFTDIISNLSSEKNYFILVVPEGRDATSNEDRSNSSVFSVGNGFLSNYTFEASVGNFPSVSINVEGSNDRSYNGTSGNEIPAVDPQFGISVTGKEFALPVAETNPIGVAGSGISVLRPGDITLNLAGQTAASISGANAARVQSFSLEIPLTREPLDQLGSPFPFSREISFPVTATLNISANINELRENNLIDIICNDESVDLQVVLHQSNCGAASKGDAAIILTLKNAKLDSESRSVSQGSNATVDWTFSSQIGGPEDTSNGFTFSGLAVELP